MTCRFRKQAIALPRYQDMTAEQEVNGMAGIREKDIEQPVKEQWASALECSNVRFEPSLGTPAKTGEIEGRKRRGV
jgi:hypothetical protein